MIVGELKSKIDSIWDVIWTGGITNPISAIEQITYLMFIKLLDDNQQKDEAKANSLGIPLNDKVFKDGVWSISNASQNIEIEFENLRWRTFHNFEP